MTHTLRNCTLAFTLLAGLLPAAAHAQTRHDQDDHTGAVYAATNGVKHNDIVAYRREENGSLSPMGTFPTGGRGSGGTIDPLQSQCSLLLSADHRFLFAVNSGSGTVSAFAVGDEGGLTLRDREPSGGGFPVALAIHGDLLYVLNSGGAGSISGFRVQRDGILHPIAGSTQRLSGTSAGGSSLAFSPDGTVLAATERISGLIDVFPIDARGAAGAPALNKSHGSVPFSLIFTPQDALVVTEAGGGPAGGSALSSYHAEADDTLSLLSASVPTGYAAACWIAATANGRFAYVANAASGEISITSVDNNGTLSVLRAAPTGAGTVPLDLALSTGDRYLYALTAGAGTITEFQVQDDGRLTRLGDEPAMAAASGQNGLAAF